MVGVDVKTHQEVAEYVKGVTVMWAEETEKKKIGLKGVRSTELRGWEEEEGAEMLPYVSRFCSHMDGGWQSPDR